MEQRSEIGEREGGGSVRESEMANKAGAEVLGGAGERTLLTSFRAATAAAGAAAGSSSSEGSPLGALTDEREKMRSLFLTFTCSSCRVSLPAFGIC